MKAIVMVLSVVSVFGQQAAQKTAPARRTFFVTCGGLGEGAKRGGIVGAGVQCSTAATAAGAGDKTWKAYLSTQAEDGKPAVNARDRIGNGPWHNAKGTLVARDLAHLHGDTVELAQLGNLVTKNNALTEKGERVNGVGDTPNMHDILTGSKPDGRAYTDNADHTCKNWTSNSEGSAQVGHSDRNGGGISWNSVHPSRGCSQANLISTGGAGMFYCFAVTGK